MFLSEENTELVNITITDTIVIPGYPGSASAKVSKVMEYDCGNGVAGDGSKSYLIIVTETDSEEFLAYKDILSDRDYKLVTEKDIASDDADDPNRFASYKDADGKYKLYTYHFPYYKETRIIIDTQADTVAGFRYTAQSGKTAKPMLAMWGLSTSENGYDITSSTSYGTGKRNCGSMLVIRMPDNSLFIHDGGDIQQWSDAACDEFLAFCRELTGTASGEKMVINTWFLSHAHSDHYLGFPRFINKYHDQFDLKNIMYNIDIERTYTTRDIHGIMQMVSGYYPNARYYKPHTGESFTIAGVKFDVMYSHEDRYVPTEDGNLVTDYPEIVDGKTTTEYDLGGTYRSYSYDKPGVMTSKSDFNDTSVVLKATFENGVNSIIYADANRAEQTMFDIYPDSAFRTNIMMVPHHGFDSHPQLCALAHAGIYLIAQHKGAAYGPDHDVDTVDTEGTYRPKVRDNFLEMRNAINATGKVENQNYKFYWGGSETVAIDINSMSGAAAAAETDSEMPSMTVDPAAPGGAVVYTAEAMSFEYAGWSVTDLTDGTASNDMETNGDAIDTTNLISTGGVETVEAVATTTKNIYFTPVTETPTVNGRYLLRSVAHPEFIMSYSPVAETPGTVNLATSLIKNTKPGNSTDSKVFFDNDKGVYLNHSYRDSVLWILKQVGVDNDKALSASKTYTKPAFGGDACYDTTRLFKGIGPVLNEDGTIAAAKNGVYWSSIEGNDTTDPITQYRFFNPRYVDRNKWMRNVAIGKESEKPVDLNRYIIEKFSDGTFLIYYRDPNLTDVRILTCDADGNWHTVRYDNDDANCDPVSYIKNNLDEFKVKLYQYHAQSASKEINFSGATTFSVWQGTTFEQVLFYIEQNITLRDPNRRDMAIPCSGDTAKVGYYWLDFNKTFNSSKTGSYTVTVKYRNDDGTDTEINKLKVKVADMALSGETHYIVMEGTRQADVNALIQKGITVTKKAGTNEETISYSETPAEGKYWLKYNYTFNSNPDGIHTYTVTVNYRNSDGTDTEVDPALMVVVRAPKLKLNGTTTYYVDEGVTKDALLTNILQNISVTETIENKTISYAGTPTAGSYWLQFDKTFDSSDSGDHDYFVKVNYRNADGSDTLVGKLRVFVEDEKITSFTAPGDKVGVVPLNAGLTTVVQKVEDETSADISFTVNRQTRYVTVGLLTDANGNRVDTSKAGTYTNLVLTYKGTVICRDFTLTVTESNEALNYPQKGEEGYVGVNKQSTTTPDQFKETGVANIELSATGIPTNKGIDLIVVMDLSGSMKNSLDTDNAAPTYQQSRVYAMEQSLKDMVKSLQSSGVEVRIAMSDFGDIDHYVLDGNQVDDSIDGKSVFDANNSNGTYANADSADSRQFEYYNHLNFVFTDDDPKPAPYGIVHTKYNKSNPSYTGVVVPTVYTGSHEVDADAFVDVNSLYNGTDFTSAMNGIIATMDANANKAIGTNYDIGLEYAYYLGHAIQQDNINKGKDRDIVCIFMSDGAPMQYNYFSGNPQSTAWVDWISGNIDSIAYTGYSETNLPDGLQELEAAMLAKLKEGKLVRPEYRRDGGIAHEGTYYFKYFPNREDATAPHFYTIMNSMNYDLDWEYLCRIAEVNGLAGFDYNMFLQDTQLTQLRNLLLDRVNDTLTVDPDNSKNSYYISKLINPGYYEERYYTACSSEETDFFKAMESIGIDCSWDLFTKIAYRNCLDEMKNLVDVLKNSGGGYATHSPYSYFYNKEGKNWWAEAIKGDPTKLYPVINKYAYESSTNQPYTYYGDVRKDYNGNKYISGYRGLGIDMYTVSFSVADNVEIKAGIAETILKRISSGPSYFFSANTQDGLTDSLNAIIGSMSNAATRAWYTDTLGEKYDLYIGQPDTNYADGTPADDSDEISTIRVLEYDLDKDGNLDGNPIVRETITIKDMDNDGDVDAWSDQVYTITTVDGIITKVYSDIWDETTNVISGRFVIYNANTTGTHSLTLDESGRTYPLPAETFFWTIGVLGETEMVLEYKVYLTGSKEGTLEVPEGTTAVFPTNKEAILHYVNYLGNNCEKDTDPPKFPWGNPVVGYAFYLVDKYGNPLDSQGRITDFSHSLKLSTAEYQKLNEGSNKINAAEMLAGSELDNLYELYDVAAAYEVIYANSSTAEKYWNITRGNDVNASTYVTDYGGAPTTESGKNVAFTSLEKTVVYFALKLEEKAQPDTVVIDYGLPVNINVLSNDEFADADAAVTGIKTGTAVPGSGGTTAAAGFGTKCDGTYGTAEQAGNLVKYTLDSMVMDKEDTFVYSAKETSTGRYYYSTVTVIPATTIYYEDGFVSYSVWNMDGSLNKETGKQWALAGNNVGADQGQDRPGNGNLPDVDADNIYGYDGAYTNMPAHSMGSAMKATVDSTLFAEAQFTFWGTDFDVVSLTSNTTGTILVDVFDADEFAAKSYDAPRVESHMVDTYYGFKYTLCNVSYVYTQDNAAQPFWKKSVDSVAAEGATEQKAVMKENPSIGDVVTGIEYSWIADTNAKDTLYQVPVMKVSGLNYDKYTVVITLNYNEALDHQKHGSYDFYLDAIRIYDPANDGAGNQVIEDAYVSDGEGWPEYFELRNLIISKNDFNSLENGTGSGIVFIDNVLDANKNISYTISDYTNYGPNNELYLAPGQAVAFNLAVPDDVAGIHLAMKSVGGTAKAAVYNAAQSAQNVTPATIATATDLYYDITSLNNKTVVITNTGSTEIKRDAILSVTNVKVTYKTEHTDSIENSYFTTTQTGAETAMASLMMMCPPVAPEETVPETTVPEEEIPETTVPETTVPEETEPAEPEVFEPEKFTVKLSATSVKAGSSVTVTVTTGADVDHIDINGTAVTSYTSNRWTKERTWKLRLATKTVGELKVGVTCYNSENVASETISKTVTVTQQYTSIGNIVGDILGGILGSWLGKWK